MVSIVIVGLVPYYAMDPDTPISSAFAGHGIQWAAYLITLGAVMALCSVLLGSLLPQPRILMTMARDGLLPSVFSDVSERTKVPVKGTIATGLCAALLAFFMDVSQLAGMVSVGTLLAFTMVAVSLLILRYVPPDEVPILSSGHIGTSSSIKQPLITKTDDSVVEKQEAQGGWVLKNKKRRKLASWSIISTCVGNFIISYAASSSLPLPGFVRYSLCGVGGLLLLVGLIVLSCIDQDDARHSFGQSGGFVCPCVPLLPVLCILINVYLLINLGAGTWGRVSVWMFIGVVIYLFYGRRNSTLVGAVYVPVAQKGEISHASGYFLA